jgi:5-methylcytosine-specific restriction endonuclease McrA
MCITTARFRSPIHESNLKNCSGCQLDLPLERFGLNKHKNGNSYHKAYCKPCEGERTKKWRLANKDRYNAYFVNRRKTDPEFKVRSAAYVVDWQRRHPQKTAAWNLAWQRANPNKVAVKCHRRRALKLSAPGSFTLEEWLDKLIQFNHCCAYCHKPLGNDVSVDHMTPLSRGGTNFISNIVPAHRRCNSSKGAKTPEEFAEHTRLVNTSGIRT